MKYNFIYYLFVIIILATISDARASVGEDTLPDSFLIAGYNPVIQSMTDYYPFGMIMPGRNISNNASHCTNVTVTVDMPVQNLVTITWPDGNAVAFGGATVSSGPSPLLLTANTGGGLTYTVSNITGGISQALSITITGTVPPGFKASITQGSTLVPLTILHGGVNTFTFTPATTGTVLLTIEKTAAPIGSLHISGITKDSISYTPEVVVSQICSESGYEYGYNGQLQVNDWSGVGNHTTALYWEYDARTGRRGNKDPVPDFSISGYASFRNNPILFDDPDGDIVKYSEDQRTKANLGWYKGRIKHLKKTSKVFSKLFQQLEESKYTYIFGLAPMDAKNGVFNPYVNGNHVSVGGGIILWNPAFAAELTTGYIISPEEILNHEVGHAADNATDPKSFDDRRNTEDDTYTNAEEKKVIDGVEQDYAREQKKINGDEHTRQNHSAHKIIFWYWNYPDKKDNDPSQKKGSSDDKTPNGTRAVGGNGNYSAPDGANGQPIPVDNDKCTGEGAH